MRCAVVVALGDPRSSDAGTWIDAVAWLRQELTELGFRVAVIDGEDVEGDLALALEGVTPQDDVLLHISGRMVARGVVRTPEGRAVRMQALGDILAEHAGDRASVFAELIYGDEPIDVAAAAEQVESVVAEVGARERGFAMVAGVRASSAPIEGLALTRLFVDATWATRATPLTRHAGALLSSAAYDRIVGTPESLACAQSFAFVRGALERAPEPPAKPGSRPGLARVESESEPPPAPQSNESLDKRIDEAAEEGAWERVIALRRERLRTIESAKTRIRELVAIARIMQVELEDPEGALEALEHARGIDPARVGVLQALRRGYERRGRWEDALGAIGALAELAESPADRAELRLSQAQMALDQLQDADRALALLRTALEHDPTHERARAALDRLSALRGETAQAGVESASAPAVKAAPSVVPPSVPPPDREAAPMQPASRPLGDPSIHARAFATHRQEGRSDAAFLAALALEELGAADAEHHLVIEQFRSVSPIRPRGTLDSPGWDLLRATGSDDALASLFAGVARAALAVRLEQLVVRKKLVALDPARRLDQQSTATVVRSFQWAARVLGVPCPVLYAVDAVPGEIAAVRAHEPSTALGPSVLSGRSAKELAFLAGRHLTYYLPEHQPLVYFPTGDDLARLLMAAIALVAPESHSQEGDPPVVALRDRLARHVTKTERSAIANASRRLGLYIPAALAKSRRPDAREWLMEEGRAKLSAWARSVELTAGRAGLLLSGDLAIATAIVRSESRPIAGLSPDNRRYDLIAFCDSPQHSELRARFAVTAPETVPPPAPMLPMAGLAEPSV